MYYSSVNLTKYNTLGTPAIARWFLTIDDLTKLQEGVEFGFKNDLEITCLGKGSNLVFRKNHNGLILYNSLLGKEVVREEEDFVLIDVWSGENWHQLVNWSIQHSWYGLENLALIPGTVGAAPIQNIGAYGAELSHFLTSVEYFDFESREKRIFNCEECDFSYRDSIFKRELLNKVFITKVTLKLYKKEDHLNCDYEVLHHYIKHHRMPLNSRSIFQAVCAIRQAKLPDLVRYPNAGSFYKNPIVTKEKLKQLQKIFPAIVYFKNDSKTVKLSGGHLIEKAGWKGFRKNGIGIHYNQALVLTNVNRASGMQVLEFADTVIESIKQKFDIDLEIEPQIYPRFDHENKPLPLPINTE